MSVHKADRLLDDKTEYFFDWLTREKPEVSLPDEDLVECHEKKFDSLVDVLHRERNRISLYKPRTSR